MRSIKNIKERVTDFGNLRDAYFHARRSKRFRNEVLEFSANLEDNLHDLQTALREQTYVPGPYKKKVIHDPVDRLIMWQAFIHRVVQWAVCTGVHRGLLCLYQGPGVGCGGAAAVLLHAAGRAKRPAGRKGRKGASAFQTLCNETGYQQIFLQNRPPSFPRPDWKKMQLRPLAYVDHGLVHKCSGRKIRFPFW